MWFQTNSREVEAPRFYSPPLKPVLFQTNSREVEARGTGYPSRLASRFQTNSREVEALTTVYARFAPKSFRRTLVRLKQRFALGGRSTD